MPLIRALRNTEYVVFLLSLSALTLMKTEDVSFLSCVLLSLSAVTLMSSIATESPIKQVTTNTSNSLLSWPSLNPCTHVINPY